MPRSQWSNKDERQYEHIKESEASRGSDRAEEIAARTVNKKRKQEGRTKAQHHERQSAAAENARKTPRGAERGDLAQKTRKELYDQAAELDIPGRSKMKKHDLVDAIAKA